MVLVIGHRGARCCAPENTIPSFRLALETGVDGVEMDVHMTRDGEVVVIHDDTLERTTTGSGYVKDHTLRELKGLDAGVKFGSQWRGVKIPTLEEVLRELGSRVSYVIELKHGSDLDPALKGEASGVGSRYRRLRRCLGSLGVGSATSLSLNTAVTSTQALRGRLSTL